MDPGVNFSIHAQDVVIETDNSFMNIPKARRTELIGEPIERIPWQVRMRQRMQERKESLAAQDTKNNEQLMEVAGINGSPDEVVFNYKNSKTFAELQRGETQAVEPVEEEEVKPTYKFQKTDNRNGLI